MELEPLLEDLARLEAGGWSDRLLQARLTDGSAWPDERRRRHTALWRLALEKGPAHRARLADCCRKRPRPLLRAALRLGWTLLEDGHPPHAVVDGVQKALAGVSAAERGLVNAVLRKGLREGTARLEPGGPASLPGWFQELLAQWDGHPPADPADFLQELVRGRQTWLRVNLSRWTPRQAIEELAAAGLDPRSAPETERYLSLGRLPAGGLSALAPLQDGRLHVQDLSAWGAIQLLDPDPGSPVLDLCAAPGGKALALLEADPGLRLTALELHAGRARELARRLGAGARVLCADAREFTESGWPRILLDAPCGGSGSVGHRPEILDQPDPVDPGLLDLQAVLLERAADLLAPGGRLVYSTCSLDPRENAGQVRRLLERRADLQVEARLVPPMRRDETGGWAWLPWTRVGWPAGRPGAGGAWAVALVRNSSEGA